MYSGSNSSLLMFFRGPAMGCGSSQMTEDLTKKQKEIQCANK